MNNDTPSVLLRVQAISRPAFFKVQKLFATIVAALRAPRLSRKEQGSFFKRLGFLLQGGTPLPDAIQFLAESERNHSIRNAFITTGNTVTEGKTLAEALKTHRTLVSPFAIAVIATGEQSGTLTTNLFYLSSEFHKRAQLSGKITGALIYPILISLFAIGISASLVVFIFPKIIPVFKGLGAALPLPTRILMALSNYLAHWGLLTLLACSGLVFAAWLLFRARPRARLAASRAALGVPLLGSLLKAFYIANLSRTLALLLASGMGLQDALPATRESVSHPAYKLVFAELIETVNEGRRLGEVLSAQQFLFPPLASRMLLAGEASGTLTETLHYLSEYYEHEFEEKTRTLTTLAEPVLMIFLGLLIGFIAISIVLPIYNLTEYLHHA